ncbi:MAG: HAD-superfamily hydrolase [Microgenomates group bacterium GW2011_GWB1_40_9]|nr:MAG: HAD-superfamily hydrolase [Microgenomates group bacterium GW2011_GWC1_39_12]KKR78998.1 MAG: HAD-superfamily hydrolase [Microgenomates group bacterium GW2011_GWB1_40_9]
MITTLIFDIGSVLLKHKTIITPQLLADTFNIPLSVAEKEYAKIRDDWRIGKIHYEQVFKLLKSKYNIDFSIEDLKEQYIKKYAQIAIIDEQMVEIVKQLSSRYSVVALTNTIDIHSDFNYERELYTIFRKAYISNQTGHKKPDKEAFQDVLDDIHVTPQECLLIDDRKDNIQTAKEMHFNTYTFLSLEKFRQFIKTI